MIITSGYEVSPPAPPIFPLAVNDSAPEFFIKVLMPSLEDPAEPVMLGPNINGDLHIGNSSDATPTNLSFGNGALGVIPKNNKWTYQSVTTVNYPSVDFDFNASRSNAIYTDNGSIHPLSLALNYIIKC